MSQAHENATALITEHLPVWTSAPNGIAKLRQLILDLAVRGRLVPQDSSDEPAGELVKRARSHAEKNMRQNAAQDAVGKWEAPDYNLPTGWAWACNALLGDTSPRNESSDDAVVAFAPMHVVPTDFRQKIVPQTRAWGEIKKGYTHFADGDIVVAKITPCFENGKACVMSNLPGGIGAGTTEFHVLRPYPKTVVPQYMLLFYQTHGFIQGGVDTFSGTAGHQRVSNDYFRFRPIPLPPLPEQHRIVAKVDELMAFCDRLEATQGASEKAHLALVEVMLGALASAKDAAEVEACWGRIAGCFEVLFTSEESVERLKKVVLELGVRGRLVRQDGGEERAGEALRRCDQIRATTSKEDHRADAELQTPLVPEAQWTIPASWAWRSLADLVLFIDYRGQTPNKVESGVRLITAKNVKKGFINIAPEEFLSETDYHAWMTRGNPKIGDILFTTEAPMGNAAVVQLPERFALAQRVICFRNYGAMDAGFLSLQILATPFQSILDDTATGLTAKGIKAAKLKRLPIAVPPLSEQCRIVAKATELLALCDTLKAQICAVQKLQGNLADAIVQ